MVDTNDKSYIKHMTMKQAQERIIQLSAVYERIPQRQLMDLVYASSLWSVEELFIFTYTLPDSICRRILALIKGYHYNKLRS